MSEKAEHLHRRLVVIWSSRDPEVAMNMVFMYTKNSKIKGWWDEVCLVVWGPSAPLLVEDQALQVELEELRAAGVQLRACKACADRYGVSNALTEMGIEVIYMGAPLTEHLKGGDTVLTF
jgi:hypothetical protein